MTTVIYVYLLDEGTDCWRPVNALHQSEDIYLIVEENKTDGAEIWQFSKGDLVRCELRKLSGGEHLVAVEKF